MGQFGFIDGHSRQTLISRVGSQVTQGGSADFGAFDVTRFSRLAGYISIPTTGATYRVRTGANSGTWDMSSSTTVTSGTTTIDMLNFGKTADLAITAVGTQTMVLVSHGGRAVEMRIAQPAIRCPTTWLKS